MIPSIVFDSRPPRILGTISLQKTPRLMATKQRTDGATEEISNKHHLLYGEDDSQDFVFDLPDKTLNPVYPVILSKVLFLSPKTSECLRPTYVYVVHPRPLGRILAWQQNGRDFGDAFVALACAISFPIDWLLAGFGPENLDCPLDVGRIVLFLAKLMLTRRRRLNYSHSRR
jgi:hypothetical protein